MNHTRSFSDPNKLLQTLTTAWEKMTKLQARLLGEEAVLQEEAHSMDIMTTVNSWNKQKNQNSCEQYLRHLVNLKLQLAKRSMTPRAWPVIYLSKSPIQNYLKWVVKVTEDRSEKTTEDKSQGNFESIKHLMQQLVDPSDLNLVRNFPDKNYISKWLYQSDQDILPLECKDFLNLHGFFKQALEDVYFAQTRSDMAQAQQQDKIYVTKCVTQVVNHLRSHLQKANQKYEDLFIVTMLYPFRYDASETIFLCLLSTNDLEYLIKNLKEQITEYFSVRETSLLKKQAYLFYLAVSVFDSAASIDVRECHVKQHLLYMQKTLQNELLPQVKDAIVTNCTDSVSGYDWTAIQSDLSSLMSGFKLTGEDEGPTLEDVLQFTSEARDAISIAMQSTQTTHPKRSALTHKDSHPKRSALTHEDSRPKQSALTHEDSHPKRSALTHEHSHPKQSAVTHEDIQPKRSVVTSEDALPKRSTLTHEDTCSKPKMAPQPHAQKEAFQALLKMVDLYKYYPQKLTPTDAVCICKETLEIFQYTEHPELLPYYIMQKVMMHNYKSRSNMLCSPQKSADSDSDSDDDDDDDDDDQNSNPAGDCGQIATLRDVHPMDGLLALIHCTNDFLRQDLMAKLSTCKLAIPFLLPDPKVQSLTFPLWSMPSMVKEWKSKSGDMECRIVDCKTPIVSFLRFSESETSKSKMLNDVIGDSEHDFFFHWDCEGGSTQRILVNGLVEVCWYLPAGKESDHFFDLITFANLHGDAREHSKQATFLSQVSFMNFVLLTKRDMNDHNGIEVLQDLAKAPGGLVLMFSDAKEDDKIKIPKGTLPRNMYNRIKLNKKNAATIKNEIRRQITQKLDQHTQSTGVVSKQFISLTDCAKIARKVGILVDEDNEDCKEGQKLATALVAQIISLDKNPDSTASVKNGMLPLQGPKLWHMWAKHDKEQHRHINRGSRGIEQYNSEKEKEKIAIRRKQLKQANPPTPVMRLFILTLLQHKGSVREYFLQWLKLLLDDRSRDKLPDLHRQYKAKRKALNKLKDKQDVDSSEVTILKSHLQKLNEQLVHSSFGLEHLLRELGQMYESVSDVSRQKTLDASHHKRGQTITTSKQLQSELFRLPWVAADLLVNGYPLELMDGDAAHLPLTWVNAVLDKLKEILGDKRLFILSVLGIQSTGKSTLMNTMFGLQFTVSAGRCTRGAFIQLLPLSEQLKADIKCDYLLIVDTEGLRAPELDSAGTQKHDNELATFVIGLADVTVINIFGEAPGDMDDILQTAVHAFLRMRNVELTPSCQFVHQNVAAISAEAKGKMGRDKFHEKLDEMTRDAAMEEQCEGQYQSFKDVISFDDEKDVWYFPTLWKGDPPMAPVNPGYSDMAQKLKFGLVCLARQKGSQCTISRFQSRIKQLWEAVLNENFIFSFKNTLEITAYNELDVKYTQWSWRLQRTMLDWEYENETVIRNAAFEKLHDLENQRIANAKTLLAQVHQEIKGDMRTFFQESKHSEILAQWQDRTERRLDDLRAEREKQAEEHCRTVIHSREAHLSVDRMQDSYRGELLKHLKKLVSKLEGKKLDETELESIFEKKWTEWMRDFTARLPKLYQQDVNIDTAFERCLRDLLRKHDQQIIEKLSHKPLRKWGQPLQLAIQPEKHLRSLRWFKGIQDEDIEPAQETSERFLQTAKQYFQDLKTRRIQNFSDGFIFDLFNKVFEDVNHFNQEKNVNFKFTSVYKVDVALTVGGYALRYFEEMIKMIKKENDPIEYLKTLKVPFSKTFKSQYYQIAKEKTAADNLCYLLKTRIVTAVTGSLGHTVADDMKAMPMFHSKRALKAQILLDLGEMNSFESYALYLKEAKASLRERVKFYTEQHCSHAIGEKSRLEELSEAKLQEVIFTITEAAKNVTHSLPLPNEANISDWLNQFHGQLSYILTFDERELKEVVGAENLEDFHFFTDEIINGLHKIQESLLEDFPSSPLSQMDNWNKQPYDILCNSMLGCCEQCPFCKEQCELTTPNHDCNHSVELHRPRCLGGYTRISTGEMVVDVCSSGVASDATFQNCDTDWKPHPYKEYQKYYPNWTITPDSSRQASSYWKWFVAKYSAKIAQHFNAKETEIPDGWMSLTWEEVKEDLKTSYNL